MPSDVLYQKGWPVSVPTIEMAENVASVRRQVSAALKLDVEYTTGAAVRDRIAELFNARHAISA